LVSQLIIYFASQKRLFYNFVAFIWQRKGKSSSHLADSRRSLKLTPLGNVPVFCQDFGFFEILISLPLEKSVNFFWVIRSFRNKISIHLVFAL